jgi:host factor-I protein
MNKTQMNLQDLFLNQVRKESTPVTIYLVSGVQLKGMVKGFDAFTVVLDTPGKPPQLVYKHAMASVVPMRPIGLREVFAGAMERAAAGRASGPGPEADEPGGNVSVEE